MRLHQIDRFASRKFPALAAARDGAILAHRRAVARAADARRRPGAYAWAADTHAYWMGQAAAARRHAAWCSADLYAAARDAAARVRWGWDARTDTTLQPWERELAEAQD